MSEEVLMRAVGLRAQLELLHNRIRIKPNGWRGAVWGIHERDILLAHITSISFRPPSVMSNGNIWFSLTGAGKVEVVFRRAQWEQFETLREAIEKAMARLYSPQAAPPTTSNLHELEKLGSLREKGIITEEEFQAKKKQLLGL